MEFSADLDTYAFQCENILLACDFNADIKQENLGTICTQYDLQQLNKKIYLPCEIFLTQAFILFYFFSESRGGFNFLNYG